MILSNLSPLSFLPGWCRGFGGGSPTVLGLGGARWSLVILFLLPSKEVHCPARPPSPGHLSWSLSQSGEPRTPGHSGHFLAALPPVKLLTSSPAWAPQRCCPTTQGPRGRRNCLGGLQPLGWGPGSQASFSLPGISTALAVLSHSSSQPRRWDAGPLPRDPSQHLNYGWLTIAFFSLAGWAQPFGWEMALVFPRASALKAELPESWEV